MSDYFSNKLTLDAIETQQGAPKTGSAGQAGVFATRFGVLFSVLALASGAVVSTFFAKFVNGTAFWVGLAIFGVSVLATLLVLLLMRGPAPQRGAGMALAFGKLAFAGGALFIALIVMRLDPVGILVGAIAALAVASLSFLATSRRWT